MAKKRYVNLGFGSNPDAVNLSALPPHYAGALGGIYEEREKRWQIMKVVDAAGTANAVVYIKSYDSKYEATMTIGNSSRNEVAGVLPAAVTQNYFTLVRQGGTLSTKAGAGTFARGTFAVSDTSSNQVIPKPKEGDAGAGADSVFQIVGVAQGATASSLVTLALGVNSL